MVRMRAYTSRYAQRAAAVVAMVAVWGLAGFTWIDVARANNWGAREADCNNQPESQCVARNYYVDYWFSSDFNTGNGPAFRTNTRAVLNSEYNNHPDNPDWIFVVEEASQSLADARLRYRSEPEGYYAWTQCLPDSTHGNSITGKAWCEPARIVFNSRYSAQYDSVDERRAMACHEMGHVFGLRHRNSPGCLNPPPGSRDDLPSHEMRCLVLYYPLTPAPPAPFNCP